MSLTLASLKEWTHYWLTERLGEREGKEEEEEGGGGGPPTYLVKI